MITKNTSSVPAKTLNPIAEFHNEMNNFFDRFMKEIIPGRGLNSFIPRIEAQELDRSFLVSVELPGMNEEDIELSINNNVLIIQGEKKKEKKREGKGFYRSEMTYGSFYRAIPLSNEVNPEKISAHYLNGVLQIEIDKVQETKSSGKKIEISKNTKLKDSPLTH